MKKWQRLIALLTLAGFAFLVTVESFHHHMNAQSEAHCSICKIAHQAVLPTHRPPAHAPQRLIQNVPFLVVPHPYLQFVFPSHGLSPPVL
jgi:hypothetical protein